MSEKTYNLLGKKRKRVLMCHLKSNSITSDCIMEVLSDKEEKTMDSLSETVGEARITRKGKTIRGKDIVLYGSVNLKSEKDVKAILDAHVIGEYGSWLYSNFDYEKGCYTTKDNGISRQYYTCDVLKYFKFCHCLLGKPKKIIIYKVPNKFILV